jgi:hypothetical protein
LSGIALASQVGLKAAVSLDSGIDKATYIYTLVFRKNFIECAEKFHELVSRLA